MDGYRGPRFGAVTSCKPRGQRSRLDRLTRPDPAHGSRLYLAAVAQWSDTTSTFTLLTVKSSPDFVHEFASVAVRACCLLAFGSISSLTTNGTVTVEDAGAVGATANVFGMPSTATDSEFPNDPVHVDGIPISTLPVIRFISLLPCVQLAPVSGTVVEAPWGAVTVPPDRALRTMLALPLSPAGPVPPAEPGDPDEPFAPGAPTALASAPGLKSAAVRDRRTRLFSPTLAFASFVRVTAPFASCLVWMAPAGIATAA